MNRKPNRRIPRIGALPGLLPLLLLGGCLYVGGQNHEPTGEIELEQSSALLRKYGKVTLRAAVNDPDGDTLSYAWKVQIKALDGHVYSLIDPRGPPQIGGFDNTRAGGPATVIGTATRLTLTNLPKRGSYTATVEVKDEQGAAVVLKRVVAVNNVAPAGITLKAAVDPRYQGRDQVPDGKIHNPGHAHYLIYISENGLVDPDLDLLCGNKATVSYKLQVPGSVRVLSQGIQRCRAREILDRLAFQLDGATIAAGIRATVQATVNDGYGGVGKGELTLDLSPNRPACVVATEPPFATATTSASVPVQAEKGLTFSVTQVSDDVEQDNRYTWQVDDGAGFATVVGQNKASFAMPAWFGKAGHKARLRVKVQDTLSSAAGCATTSMSCRDHPRLPDKCYRWVTWNVEFF